MTPLRPSDFAYNEVPGSTTIAPTPIRPNVRAALDYLDNILSRDGQDAQDLWDILTAFRGPDESQYIDDHKVTATIPIRNTALPLTAATVRTARASNAYFSSRTTPGVVCRASFGGPGSCYRYLGPRREGPSHFDTHAYRAAQALGLI